MLWYHELVETLQAKSHAISPLNIQYQNVETPHLLAKYLRLRSMPAEAKNSAFLPNLAQVATAV